jgi:hypothetical protein
MKRTSYKPFRIIDGYLIKPQQGGYYKIVEYSSMSNGQGYKKRTVAKNLDLSTAEAELYKLEKQNKKP